MSDYILVTFRFRDTIDNPYVVEERCYKVPNDLFAQRQHDIMNAVFNADYDDTVSAATEKLCGELQGNGATLVNYNGPAVIRFDYGASRCDLFYAGGDNRLEEKMTRRDVPIGDLPKYKPRSAIKTMPE